MLEASSGGFRVVRHTQSAWARRFVAAGASVVVGAAAAVVAGLLGACARPEPPAVPQLQLRAAFDLGCPPQDVQILHFDQRTKGVVGCGRRLTYVASCDGAYGSGACTWVLDSPGSLSTLGAGVPAPGAEPYGPRPTPRWPGSFPYPSPTAAAPAPPPAQATAVPTAAASTAPPAPAASATATRLPPEADFGF